jgi:hypothetical protein
MRLVTRWGVAVGIGAAGFTLAWWICQKLIGLDEGISLGIAGALLAVLLAVGSWWAPLGADAGRPDGAVREQASPVGEKAASVENTISGGTFSGPVLQGRDFTGLTFGASPEAPRPRPGDPDAGS